MQSTLFRRSAAASTSAGIRRSFAPFTTKMRFWPLGSTKMGATPLDTPSSCLTCVVSIPSRLKFSMVAGPNRSLPTRAIMKTSAPHSRQAVAWFAPLPPKPKSNESPKIVSPGFGKRLLKVVRSIFALPTTAIRGRLAISSFSSDFNGNERRASLVSGARSCQREGRSAKSVSWRDGQKDCRAVPGRTGEGACPYAIAARTTLRCVPVRRYGRLQRRRAVFDDPVFRLCAHLSRDRGQRERLRSSLVRHCPHSDHPQEK